MQKGSVLHAKFQTVTPAFCAGAKQDKPELKASSVLGALGFWWRALKWAQLAPGAHDKIKTLRDEETEIFGSTSEVRSFLPTLLPDSQGELKNTRKDIIHQSISQKSGAVYLGYGVVESFPTKGKLTRPCLNPNQSFTLKLRFRKDVDDSICDALKLLGLLGGIGSRSRKGYGSLTLKELRIGDNPGDKPVWTRPTSFEALAKELNTILSHSAACTEQPPFSAFSSHARIDYLKQGNDAIELLDFLGNAMQRYRSAGFHGKVNGKPSERNFQDDHDWCKNPSGFRKGFHPERVIFGLPHNSFNRDERDKKKAKPSCVPAEHTRRASPLIFHVHEFEPGRYCALSTLLESDFLPSGEKIKADQIEVPQKAEYCHLHHFLDHTGTPPGASPSKPAYFPNRKPILP